MLRFALLSSEPVFPWAHAVLDELRARGHHAELLIGGPRRKTAPPDAAWTRTMPEQMRGPRAPLHWQSAQLLEALGVPLLNSLASQERAANKLLAYELISRAGLPQPITFSLDEEVPADFSWPAVCKPQFGSRGWGIREVSDYRRAVAHSLELCESCLIQRHVQAVRCIRAIATPEQVISAYEKHQAEPGQLVVSVSGGADRVPIEPTADIERLACGAVRAIGAGMCGVDLIEDGVGRIYVLEINASFAFDADDCRIITAYADELESLVEG